MGPVAFAAGPFESFYFVYLQLVLDAGGADQPQVRLDLRVGLAHKLGPVDDRLSGGLQGNLERSEGGANRIRTGKSLTRRRRSLGLGM